MAYFNHAFTKRFLGTGTTLSGGPITSDLGFVTTNGITSAQLSQLPVGYFAFFNPKTWVRVDAPANCCPLILASSSLLTKDKISPFLGGYKETNKSKLINPKYVHKFYRVDPCTPQQAVISIGNTVFTKFGIATALVSLPVGTDTTYVGPGSYVVAFQTITGTGSGAVGTVTVNGAGVITGVVITSPGGGYTPGDIVDIDNGIPVAVAGTTTQTATVSTTVIEDPKCCFEFLCGETYYLRIDVKGSPALRALNHNAYQNIYAYTGCCPDGPAGPVPTPVDSTNVMILWATMVVENNYLNPFLFPVVYDESGVAWFPPGSTVDPLGASITPAQWWTAYVSPGHTPGACAGLRLFGAYVDTKFGDCSFQITDFFEKEPIKIYASLVDINGDPCIFEGICVYNECLGVQGMGFGEQVLRDIILSESYLQNFFHTDIRIREITQGSDLLAAVNRNFLYTRYFLLHTVPRYNNPTGTFDNEQYMLEIITTAPIPTFETYMNTWLDTCPDCVAFEVESCTPCVITPTF
jgi:hypothetical protein